MKTRVFRRFLDVGCLLLLTSVLMDTYLWVSSRYMIPSWTMAAMSAGMIVLLQVLARVPLSHMRRSDG